MGILNGKIIFNVKKYHTMGKLIGNYFIKVFYRMKLINLRVHLKSFYTLINIVPLNPSPLPFPSLPRPLIQALKLIKN